MASAAACALVVLTAAAAAPGASSGVAGEAALPANAATGGNQRPDLGAISCPSTGDCTAVGGYIDSSGNGEPLLMSETAGAWSVGVGAVLPANATAGKQASGLDSVSCPSPGDCAAVGTYLDSAGNDQVLLLNETDGVWSTGVEASLPANAVPSGPPYPSPYQAPRVLLSSVSCGSVGNCVAVGDYVDDSGWPQGLLLTETAGSWSPGLEAPLPPDANPDSVSLESVSCASAGNCTAVGTYLAHPTGYEGLLLTETAGTWKSEEAPLPPDADTAIQGVSLSSVSCASAGSCSAVGSYWDGSVHDEGLLLTETAGSWWAVKASLPSNAASSPPDALTLSSVSCAAPGHCSAVGTYYDAYGDHQGLLLSETAGRWAAGLEAGLPNATAPGIDNLWSVSCSSPGNCTAVGEDRALPAHGLLLNETDGTWTTGVEAPFPANIKPGIYGGSYPRSVSCPSLGNCSVVGIYGDYWGSGEGLLIGGHPPTVGLEIAKRGKGSGSVSSHYPRGIDCGPTCAASFDSGTLPTLTAHAAPGSRFSGWAGGGCSGTANCFVNTGIGEQTVTAKFSLLPKCIVPRLKGKTLKAAKLAVTSHNCGVGKITHATSRRVDRGRVISQQPGPGKQLDYGARVNLEVSKGP